MAKELRIRDFIYLDVERMKSIFSQMEEGLIESQTHEKGNDKKLSAQIAPGWFLDLIAKAEGRGELVLTKKDSQTRTLHDHMYNLIEKKMINEDKTYYIDETNIQLQKLWKKGKLNELISDTSFVLIKGKVMIDDYVRFEEIASNFYEIDNVMNFRGTQSNKSKPKKKNKKHRRPNVQKGNLPKKEEIEGLSTIMKHFYKNNLILKINPFPSDIFLRFIADLDKEFLRNPIESIIFKYGTAPVSDWYVFGQISSIFPRNSMPNTEKLSNIIKLNSFMSNNPNYPQDKDKLNEFIEIIKELNLDPEEIELSKNIGFDFIMEEFFNGLRKVDDVFSPKFPTITITPIAIYREN